MATFFNPMESLELFTFPEKNDQTIPQFTIPDDYFFDTTLPVDPTPQHVSTFQQQRSPVDFQFPTSLDPLLQDPKDITASYPTLDSDDHGRRISPSSSICGDEQVPSGMPSQETWSQAMLGDPKGNMMYLRPQPTFDGGPMPTPSYDCYHGDFFNPTIDPSFTQHGPTSVSAWGPPFDVPFQSLSQPPSLSPSRSEDSYQQQPSILASHSVTPAAQLSPTLRSSRNASIHSLSTHISRENNSGANSAHPSDEEAKERLVCPYPDCGKHFKDLKAHMLTHQTERPEKCPIVSCDFHKRGFARKYDRNRHLITTHYKATVICGFCPGEGSASETSFNRIDIFKRHLVAHHNVDQNNTTAKKRMAGGSLKLSPTPDGGSSGRCTTCSKTFPSAQSLFDHIDDCVLAVVTHVSESESVNERNLRPMVDDKEVCAILKRNSVSEIQGGSTSSNYADNDNGSDDNDDVDARPRKAARTDSGNSTPSLTEREGRSDGHLGITYSKGGVDLSIAKGRRKRKHYPQSWGCSADDMTLKKRVLCCFDGQRRLLKDDMMLGNEFHKRVQLPDGGYVTDLDVQTLKRADAFHNATDEERGPWMATNCSDQHMPPPIGV